MQHPERAIRLSPNMTDAFELELRQLQGVTFVAFAEQHGSTLVELAVLPDADGDQLRRDALRVASGYLEGPIVVDVVDGRSSSPDARRSPMRVQLVMTVPVAGTDRVEVHLAHLDRRARSEAAAGDRRSVAAAVVTGLGDLGLPVPYVPDAVHVLPPELGNGTLVVMRHRLSGALRRGTATGRSLEEATARAVLSALNRHLQSSTPPGAPPLMAAPGT